MNTNSIYVKELFEQRCQAYKDVKFPEKKIKESN